jgi:hypothetical protein
MERQDKSENGHLTEITQQPSHQKQQDNRNTNGKVKTRQATSLSVFSTKRLSQ